MTPTLSKYHYACFLTSCPEFAVCVGFPLQLDSLVAVGLGVAGSRFINGSWLAEALAFILRVSEP